MNIVRNANALLVVFFLLLSGASAALTETTIQPDATDGNDTYMRQDLPNNNFGTSATFFIGKSASNDSLRALMKFNLTPIPEGDTITSALLRVYVNNSGSGASVTAEARKMLNSWDEASATWNNRTTYSAWASSGGDFSSVENSTIITSNGWYSFDVTSLVKGWHNGTISNKGLIIKTAETGASEFRGFYSSDASVANERPMLAINHTQNVPPAIGEVSDNSSAGNPTLVGSSVTFTVSWSDTDSPQARIFICSNSSVNTTGCGQRTFCSTDFSASSAQSCSYTANASDASQVNYNAGVCDNEGNCSASSAQSFYVNHLPGVTVTSPNGGETVNQSLGNYSILFDANDTDNNTLAARLYYSEVQGAMQNLIAVINLTHFCTDIDGTAETENNCSYSWNSTNIYGAFYIDITVNDTLQTSNDSSDASFNVRSLSDGTPPNITNASITGNLTSGETATVTANVSEPFIKNVTLEVNNSEGALGSYAMSNSSRDIYSANFTPGTVGNYSFRVVAYDTTGNSNATDFTGFNVSEPETHAGKDSPSSVTPASIISVRGTLNATDVLRGVNATLNAPSGFAFLSETSRTQDLGTFSQLQQKNVSWYVSAPVAEGTYALNITFIDQYGNVLHESNFNMTVSQAAATGLFVDVNSQVEIEAGEAYVTEVLVTDNTGDFVNADSIRISLFDPLGNTIVSNVSYSSQQGTGRYNYTYTTSASHTQGEWITQAAATKGSLSSLDRRFWKLTGGPFDVRNISVLDNTVPDMSISVITENTGGNAQDMTLQWNLTRSDNNAQLASGADTFAVSAQSTRTWTVYPSASYQGSVKITFLGTWSGTEKAGAFLTFDTAAAANATPTPAASSSQGGGGGGGGAAAALVPVNETAASNLYVSGYAEIKITAGESVIALVQAKNTGGTNLSNLSLRLSGIPRWFTIYPDKVKTMPPGRMEYFTINLTVPEDAKTSYYEFFYIVASEEVSAEYRAHLNVTSLKEELAPRLSAAKAEFRNIQDMISAAKARGLDVAREEALAAIIGDKITEAEGLINSQKIQKAKALLGEIEERSREVRGMLEKKGVPAEQKPDYTLAVIAMIVIAYFLVKSGKLGRLQIKIVALKERAADIINKFRAARRETARKPEAEKPPRELKRAEGADAVDRKIKRLKEKLKK